MTYRLVLGVTWDQQPRDAAAAVAWVVRTIGAYGGSGARVHLMGHSAGCHLAALVAADGSYLAAEGLPPTALSSVIAYREVPGAGGNVDGWLDESAPAVAHRFTD